MENNITQEKHEKKQKQKDEKEQRSCSNKIREQKMKKGKLIKENKPS